MAGLITPPFDGPLFNAKTFGGKNAFVGPTFNEPALGGITATGFDCCSMLGVPLGGRVDPLIVS